MESRHYESMGNIKRRLWMDFYSALIQNGVCCGAVFYNEAMNTPEAITADSVVIATGGQMQSHRRSLQIKNPAAFATGFSPWYANMDLTPRQFRLLSQ